ncbi:MAG: D-alanyl-D-alanine carboxypeptidase family protein [Bacillota bacterium]
MGRKLLCILAASLMLVNLWGVQASAAGEQLLSAGPVEVMAPLAYLMDATTGTELYAKAEHERRAPASMTKIATLAVVFDALAAGEISTEDQVTASPRAASLGGSQIYLAAGEQMSVEDLLLAVAVSSANDASVALAEHVSGTVEGFVDDMNSLVSRLGLQNTHFTNPHGLDDDDHYSSAHDLARLGRYLVTHHPGVTEYTSTWSHWLREDTDRPFWLTNTNRLLQHYVGLDGLKTGKTDRAMWCLTATAAREATRLIATVMGAETSDHRFDDVARLLDAGFASVETVILARPGDTLTTAVVWDGQQEQVDLGVPQDAAVTIPRGAKDQVAVSTTVDADALVAPVGTDQVVGSVRAEIAGEVVGEFPLVPVHDVERCSMMALFGRIVRRLWFMR